MLGKFVGLVLSCVLVLLVVSAGPVVWWYDRNFQGLTLGPKLPLIPCCRITIGAGPVLADRQAIATLKRAFATEQASFNVEKAAVDAQNRAALALKASADAWQAKSMQAVQQASGANAWRLRTADAILQQKRPANMSEIDECRLAETVLRGAAR